MNEITEYNLKDFIAETRRLLPLMQGAEWTGTEEISALDHACNVSEIILSEDDPDHAAHIRSVMHFIRNSDGKTLAITGNNDVAGERARLIVGLIHSLPAFLDLVENTTIEQKDDRILELIKSNNQKLFENREQREQIRALKAREARLLTLISDEMLNRGID